MIDAAPVQAPAGWERILVRLPNWVGDVVMATPALRALRRAFPGAWIAGALKGYVAPVLAGTSLLDEIIVLGENEERGPQGIWRVSRRLRARRFDAALLLTNSLTTALPPFLAGIRRRIGFTGDCRKPLLTHRRSPDRAGSRRRPVPMPAYYQQLLDLIGVPPAGLAYELPLRDQDRKEAERALGELGWDPRRPLVALNPGARFGSSKLWFPERMAAVARALRDRRGWQPLVLCGPGEEELVAEICAQAGTGVLDGSRVRVDLTTLRGVLAQAALLVTTDTGPRHMAVALGCPTVVIMGPTHPGWTACNLERTLVLRHDVPCGPCHLKTCPLDHACMDRVTVEEVLAAVDRLGPGS